MFIKIILLLTMIFLHILDDFHLQGILANFKQRSWWKENEPHKMYKNDYIIALFIHSFSWAFAISIPCIIYNILYYRHEEYLYVYLILFVFNMVIHMIIDHLKANIRRINLTTDQYLHLLQIVVTWFILIYVI